MQKYKTTSLLAIVLMVAATMALAAPSPAGKASPSPGKPPKVNVESTAAAADGTISARVLWDASPGEVAGYRVIYGTEKGVLSELHDAGKVTETLVKGLADKKQYYFSVIAYYTGGFDSVPATEVAMRPEPPSNVRIEKASLVNVSTRAFISQGDQVLIGGFIIKGGAGTTARVVVRALGPSMAKFGLKLVEPNPNVTLMDSNGKAIASNDDWETNRAELEATKLAPSDAFESALVADLAPGAYTAIVKGKSGGGIGLVEVYQLDG